VEGLLELSIDACALPAVALSATLDFDRPGRGAALATLTPVDEDQNVGFLSEFLAHVFRQVRGLTRDDEELARDQSRHSGRGSLLAITPPGPSLRGKTIKTFVTALRCAAVSGHSRFQENRMDDCFVKSFDRRASTHGCEAAAPQATFRKVL
jgi:hypothetical protein